MEENTKKPFKTLVILLLISSIVLAGVLVYVWVDRGSLIDDLTSEKNHLTLQMVELQSDYSILSTSNDSLNVQLDREKEKVSQLIVRMKQTAATNRSKMRQYEKELGTLRSIMRHYIVQIDSLNILNTELREDAKLARAQASQSNQKYEKLSKTTDEYAKQIEKGSVIKGRAVVMTAINASNKETNRSSRVTKFKTCLNLVENSIANKGPIRIYIRVKGPDGILMTGDQQQMFELNGEQMIYSASREIDYQGAEVEICIYFESKQKLVKGVYSVEAYIDEGKLGSGDILLK